MAISPSLFLGELTFQRSLVVKVVVKGPQNIGPQTPVRKMIYYIKWVDPGLPCLSGRGPACQAKLNVRPGRPGWPSATLGNISFGSLVGPENTSAGGGGGGGGGGVPLMHLSMVSPTPPSAHAGTDGAKVGI